VTYVKSFIMPFLGSSLETVTAELMGQITGEYFLHKHFFTGKLDSATLAMIERPRCGMKDQLQSQRSKRYTHVGGSQLCIASSLLW